MAKVRSPSYPAIGLRDAVEKIEKVYANDYQNRLPRKVVVEHMGYQSLNGKSLGVLSAVGKYGLLEGRGDENRVSDLALQIIAHLPGTPERAQALVQAARNPELFADLDSRFSNGRASDASIRSYLITQRFIPTAADAAIRAYRETKALVAEEAAGYSGDSPNALEVEAPAMAPATVENSPTRRLGMPLPPIGGTQPGERELVRSPLSRDSGYRLLVTGDIGAKELGKIIKMLTLQRELLLESETDPEDDPDSQL